MVANPKDFSSDSKETGRIEAFSDGVFAIAITLLILEIKVPHDLPEGQGLFDALFKQWPSFLAFLISFSTILVMWINHHRMFTRIKRSDNIMMFLNGLLLLGITFLPFPTALMAEFIQKNGQQVAAVVIYNATFVIIAIFFNLFWSYASHSNRLLDPRADSKAVENITKAYRFGPLFYVVTLLVGIISPLVSIILDLMLAVYFGLSENNQDRLE